MPPTVERGLKDDCFAFGGERLMPLSDALAILKDRIKRVTVHETVPLAEATGRILAADMVAERDVPPHDNAAVDGYAVYFDDLSVDAETRLAVVGRAAAGHPFGRTVKPGEAVRIFTGAPMPPGPDTVFMEEDCVEEGGEVTVKPGIKRGANRRFRGEDVEAGLTVIPKGRLMRAQEIGLAASLGLSEIGVFSRLKVAIFSTGDEIRNPGTAVGEGCIYDANRYALMGLLQDLGCRVTDLGILPDRMAAIRDALAAAAPGHDLLITSGGMSRGEEDHVKEAVEALGALHFWRLAIKPGRPIALGQIGPTAFVGLPGNPVAVMVTFMRIARPVILRLAGRSDIEPRAFRVRARFAFDKKRGRREWLRVSLARAEDGSLEVRKFARDGAGILMSMVDSDGLVELPEDQGEIVEGSYVDFIPFSEIRA